MRPTSIGLRSSNYERLTKEDLAAIETLVERIVASRFEQIDTRLERIENKLDEHDGYFAVLSEKVNKLDHASR